MFEKPYRVKTSSKLRSSDKKKWIESLKTRFNVTTEGISLLQLDVIDIYKSKIFCHDGNTVNLYSSSDNPLFIEVDDNIIPTVYSLWLLPDFLPSFTTYPDVLPKLQAGADFMVPGIIRTASQHEQGLYSFGSLQKGAYCYLNCVGNRAAIAVGYTNMSCEDMYRCAGRGKAVMIVHVIGDNLYNQGTKSIPPVIPMESISGGRYSEKDMVAFGEMNIKDNGTSEEIDEEDEPGRTTGATEVDTDLDTVAKEEDIPEMPGEDCSVMSEVNHEELLELCFLHALKFGVKDKDMPILISTLFGKFVHSYCPPGQSFDIKKTRYKKVGNFVKSASDQGLITVETVQNGVQSITSINKDHDDISGLRCTLTQNQPSAAGGDSSKNDFTPPVIEEVFFLTEPVMMFFHSSKFRKGDALLASEIRSTVTEFIKSKGLQCKNNKQK